MSKVFEWDNEVLIKEFPNANPSHWYSGDMVEREDVLNIIEKYKVESEETTNA